MADALITLVSVVALLLGSPGPAPLALSAVGASFGVKQGIPFLVGILFGLAFAIAGAVLGLSLLFSVHSSTKTIVQVVGGFYIVYIAIKIATAPLLNSEESCEKTPSFVDGFVLNLLNPKAYAAFFAIFSQFLLPIESQLFAYLFTAFICMLVAAVVDTIWLVLGGAIRPVFQRPGPARFIRVSFALLMVGVVAWTLFKSV